MGAWVGLEKERCLAGCTRLYTPSVSDCHSAGGLFIGEHSNGMGVRAAAGAAGHVVVLLHLMIFPWNKCDCRARTSSCYRAAKWNGSRSCCVATPASLLGFVGGCAMCMLLVWGEIQQG